MIVEHGHQRLGLLDIGCVASHLEHGETGARHVGIVVERATVKPLAGAVGVEEPAVLVAHAIHHEAPGAGCGGKPVVALEDGGGVGQRRDHQAVPVGQNLVIPARPDTLVAHGLKLGAQDGEALLLFIAQETGARLRWRMLWPSSQLPSSRTS